MTPQVNSPRRHALSTWLYGRALGLVFFIAFVSLGVQLLGLVGSGGLVPAAEQLARISARFGDRAPWALPTLAWVNASDGALVALTLVGGVSALALAVGVLPVPASLLCIVAYVSLVRVGGPFTRFQWDALLIETGAASLPCLPLVAWHRPGTTREPPALARWVPYLLLFKLMFLSGWVKLASGDPTWRNLEALAFHYETQPLPNPVSYYAHQLPLWLHRACCGAVLALELGLPWLLAWPRGRRWVALGTASLMLLILLTGSYGFFNLLVLALCVPLLDDDFWLERLPRRSRLRGWVDRAAGSTARRTTTAVSTAASTETRPAASGGAAGVALGLLPLALLSLIEPSQRVGRALACLAIAIAAVGFGFVRERGGPGAAAAHGRCRAALVGGGSRAVRQRGVETLAALLLFGSCLSLGAAIWPEARKASRAAIGDLQRASLFNSYGLFAVMTTERREVAIEGSLDGERWRAYELPYQPGDPGRMPSFLLGHMPRLDWQLWFAALGNVRQNPWVLSLLERLGEGEPNVLALFEKNPFPDRPPRFLRATIREYRFTTLDERARTLEVWRRGPPRAYSPTIRLAGEE